MRFKVIGVGEVLWDVLPEGRMLGGAPANFAYHAGALGAEAWVISRVGNDDLGRDALQRLRDAGLWTEQVQVDDRAPTGTVEVDVTRDGQPRFTIHEGVAWDCIEATTEARRAVAAADAVCFGTLAQRSPRSRSSIEALLNEVRSDALRVFDVNLRQHYYSREILLRSLAIADVLKVNDTEWPELVPLLAAPPPDLFGQMARLEKQFELSAVALTRGASGSVVMSGGKVFEVSGRPVEVRDTIGAGDAFTAALTMGMLLKRPIDEVHQFAAELARYVCSCSGGMPELPAKFREWSGC